MSAHHPTHGAEACRRGGRAPLLPYRAFAQETSRAHGMAVIGDLKYAAGFRSTSTT